MQRHKTLPGGKASGLLFSALQFQPPVMIIFQYYNPLDLNLRKYGKFQFALFSDFSAALMSNLPQNQKSHPAKRLSGSFW